MQFSLRQLLARSAWAHPATVLRSVSILRPARWLCTVAVMFIASGNLGCELHDSHLKNDP